MSRSKTPPEIFEDVLPPAGGVYERQPDGALKRIEGTENFGEAKPSRSRLETPSKEA